MDRLSLGIGSGEFHIADPLLGVGIALLAASVGNMLWRDRRRWPNDDRRPQFWDHHRWLFWVAPHLFQPGLVLFATGALVALIDK